MVKLITKRKNHGEIIQSADPFGNVYYVLMDKDGNFVRSSNNYNELHKELYRYKNQV